MLSDELREKLLGDLDCFSDIIGQDETKEQLKSALLSGRHVIIVGPPGIGKTTLAKNVARILPSKQLSTCAYHCDTKKPICPECRKGDMKAEEVSGEHRFVRVQGSPDLTSEDLIGDIDPVKALAFGPSSEEAFTPGKIFMANNGVLFFDELNRCPERLQNALLQVLEESEATIGSYRTTIGSEFIFVGTMNPDDTSTEKLSSVFLDRFDVISMTYPEELETEKLIVLKKGKKLADFPDQLLGKTINFVRVLRESKKIEKAPSVRASIGLYERAQANAILRKRDSVEMGDIIDAIMSVLSHRIELKPSARYALTPEQFLKEEVGGMAEMSEGDYR